MITNEGNRPDREGVAWACAAGIAIITVAGLLVAVRDTIDNTNVALILVVFVVAAAVLGGRLAGVTAAVVAGVSFNFFHTQPYLTLRIKEGEDIVTVVLLVVVGLAVGELALLSRRSRSEAVLQAEGAHRIERALALLAADADVDETWAVVQAGLVDELGVKASHFVPEPASADTALLTRSGRVVPTLSSWAGRAFQLPEELAIPVVAGRGVLGHIAVEATPGRGVTLDERRVAVALADVLAVALERTGRVHALS
jgi:K+-sensing histidine kinase KdpD